MLLYVNFNVSTTWGQKFNSRLHCRKKLALRGILHSSVVFSTRNPLPSDESSISKLENPISIVRLSQRNWRSFRLLSSDEKLCKRIKRALKLKTVALLILIAFSVSATFLWEKLESRNNSSGLAPHFTPSNGMGINIKSLLRFPSCGGRKIDARSVGEKIFIFVGHKYSSRVLHFWSDFSKLASDYRERHNLCKTLEVLSQLTATWIFDRYKTKLCCECSNFAFKSLSIKVWLVSGSFSIIETQFWFSIFFLWSLLRMAIWMYPQ